MSLRRCRPRNSLLELNKAAVLRRSRLAGEKMQQHREDSAGLLDQPFDGQVNKWRLYKTDNESESPYARRMLERPHATVTRWPVFEVSFSPVGTQVWHACRLAWAMHEPHLELDLRINPAGGISLIA